MISLRRLREDALLTTMRNTVTDAGCAISTGTKPMQVAQNENKHFYVMGSLVHPMHMSSTLPLPPREQLYLRYCSNKHTHFPVY